MKKCYKCKIEKENCNFGKLKSSPDGLKYDCKSCRSEYNKQNREHIKIKNKEYYEKNKEILLQNNKEYRILNREKILEQRKEYRNQSEIKEHIKQKNKEYLEIRKNKIKEKRNNDLSFKISEILRSKFNREIKRNKYSNFLGCDIKFLKQWLEYRFTSKMNWDNMGAIWHIDHILPISNFDLTNPDEIKICYNWTNLQPLDKTENIAKSNHIYLHHYFNNLISVFRFNTTNNNFIGYQAVNESLRWLRINASDMVKIPRMISYKNKIEMDNPQPSY